MKRRDMQRYCADECVAPLEKSQFRLCQGSLGRENTYNEFIIPITVTWHRHILS
jgi:hypothetical protein